MKLVLDTVAAEEGRFSNVDPSVLRAAAADERTATGPQVEHRASLTAPVVGYSASLRKAFETAKFGSNPAQVRKDLEDVLRTVQAAGHRPVLVVDDTEKFVEPGVDGQIDVESVGNLFHHGIRTFLELSVDLVVAMHPRFEEVGHVTEVVSRHRMTRIDVLELPADDDEPALGQILLRRMSRRGIDATVESVIEPEAVADLQLLYHERDRDLRSVLQVAQQAAEHAVARGATRVEPRDVRAVVAASRG